MTDLDQGTTAQDAPVIGHPGDGERLAGIKAKMQKTLSKRGAQKPKAARPAVTYRAQRRNEARAQKKAMYRIGADVQEGWSPSVELNRSPNFPRAQSYTYAREISPCPERP
ncbi:hypothetical protein JYG45_23740, partial [Escherichia fergusonii]|uniref:hypothetical protein n=1 Tax=Escherichia fergusonii TaxID=564 RepID=UPI001CBE0BF2